MLRPAAPAACAALLLAAAPSPALADKPPESAQIREAAEQFDGGVAAYKQRDFEAAASRFEAADAAVPSPKALRQAIRARTEAGQSSRAATLAAWALTRYHGDAATEKLARDTIKKAAPRLHRLGVHCTSPCVPASGARSVHGEPGEWWVVYLDPGKSTLSASFSEGAGSAQQDVDAIAGGSSDIELAPEPPPKVAEPSSVSSPDATRPVASLPADASSRGAGISPALFIAGLVATAAVGGVTVWSGIDTLQNPGRDAVRKACVGLGEACPAYQLGLQHQARTNILIGATAGVAAATLVVGVFFTNFHGEHPQKTSPSALAVRPFALVDARGALVGALGAF